MPQSDKKSVSILIVDDSPDSRVLYSKALAMENYNVMTASDGVQALQKLEENCPDIIMLDLSMPNMDGTRFIKELRENKKCKNSKVLIVSGWDNLKILARDLGADGFLRKPVDLNTLYSEIEKQLAQ